MEDCEKFIQKSLPEKEDFYSNLNNEYITDTDARMKKEIKNLGDYHYLYAQSNTLLLADVYENFRNICLEVYELDPALFFTAPRINMASSLRKEQSSFRSFD